MTMLAGSRLLTAGGFVFRVGQAVAVSMAGFTIAILTTLFLILPVFYALSRILPELPASPLDYGAAVDRHPEAARRVLGWLTPAVNTLTLAVPTVIPICLLMPEAAVWLKRLATFVMAAFVGIAVLDFVLNTLHQPAVQYWYSDAASSTAGYSLFALFALVQLLFAGFVLRAAGIRRI